MVWLLYVGPDRSHPRAMVRRLLIPLAALTALVSTSPALAALPVGAKAPLFVTQGALNGQPFAFDLKKALRKGPVVLYFYPKAFTQGCTLEAHAFSEATEDFRKVGATVIGMSADDFPTLQKFSTEACRGKFAVATASPDVIRAYDVALVRPGMPTGLTDRTSYVIARDGRIVMVHSELDYRDHVRLTLEAARKLRR